MSARLLIRHQGKASVRGHKSPRTTGEIYSRSPAGALWTSSHLQVDTGGRRAILVFVGGCDCAGFLAATGVSTLAAVVRVMDMRTEIIDAESISGRRRALDLLRSGGLVVFPTDTVYGLAAYPWDDEAVRRLYQVKERPKDLPIPLLLSDAGQLDQVAVLSERCRGLPARFWPGPLTLVLPKKAVVSEVISQRPTVAVRVPDSSLARDVIRGAGGVLAVTSANISGEASPVTAQEVEVQLGGRIPLILDGGACPVGVASTILDCSVSPPLLLRRGVISKADLDTVIGAVRLA
jgi:L-threonylcarbamoyladenylate synthase